jgi:hypothetical protein
VTLHREAGGSLLSTPVVPRCAPGDDRARRLGVPASRPAPASPLGHQVAIFGLQGPTATARASSACCLRQDSRGLHGPYPPGRWSAIGACDVRCCMIPRSRRAVRSALVPDPGAPACADARSAYAAPPLACQRRPPAASAGMLMQPRRLLPACRAMVCRSVE